MDHDHHNTLADYEMQPIGDRARKWSLALFGVGAVALLAGFGAAMAMGGWKRFGFTYLAAFAFALSIGLGCLLLVLVTHLFRAGWVVVVRRVMECFAAGNSVMVVLFVPVLLYALFGGTMLYPWAGGVPAEHGEAAEHAGAPIVLVADEAHGHETPAVTEDEGHGEAAAHGGTVNTTFGEYGDADAAKESYKHEMLEWKQPFLNRGMFSLLLLLFFAVWIILGLSYYKLSVKQDETKDPKLTNRREWFAPLSTLLFALTTTFAAFLLLMSLDVTWYSTMYGVYYFAGCMTGALSTLILVLTFLRKAGVLTSATVDHMHDLGKLMFAFVVFWAYIAYSQYMLIWYGSIPAEQPWMVIRGMSTAHFNGFSYFAVFMLFGHFLLPFCFLLSRHMKRNPVTLAIGAIWMLCMQACDIFWLVLPEYQYKTFPLPVPEVLCMIGAAAILLGAAAHFASKAAPVAYGDPRLGDSLKFRNY